MRLIIDIRDQTTILVSKLKMVEYLSGCNRREVVSCESEVVRGCGQSWLAVGE